MVRFKVGLNMEFHYFSVSLSYICTVRCRFTITLKQRLLLRQETYFALYRVWSTNHIKDRQGRLK